MSQELALLRHEIEVSRSIVSKSPEAGEDPVIHEMIVADLRRRIPELERRAAGMVRAGAPR